MLWLSSHFTNVLYYVQLERRCGSFITTLENSNEDVSSDDELP